MSSDAHFWHANIIRLCNRPFDSVEQMNQALLHNINEVVGPDDTFYILGDFCWRFDQGWKILDQINCNNIHFIYGNHDPDPTDKRVRFYNHPKIKSHQQYLELFIDGKRFVLFHYPIESWNGMYRNSTHLCGHDHTLKQYDHQFKKFNVGVDANAFKPVLLDDIVKFFDKRKEMLSNKASPT